MKLPRLKHVQAAAVLAALALLAIVGLCDAAGAREQVRKDEYPTSIMREEPARPPARRMKRRGSSSPSPVPQYRSVVTPLGQPPRIIETRPLGNPPAPSTVVPGVSGNAGPAMTPPRPAGRSFQDRAADCVHAGTAAGVGPGQIGAYTQSCVNQ